MIFSLCSYINTCSYTIIISITNTMNNSVFWYYYYNNCCCKSSNSKY